MLLSELPKRVVRSLERKRAPSAKQLAGVFAPEKKLSLKMARRKERCRLIKEYMRKIDCKMMVKQIAYGTHLPFSTVGYYLNDMEAAGEVKRELRSVAMRGDYWVYWI